MGLYGCRDPTPIEAVFSDNESTDIEVSEYDHIVEERLPEPTADSRVIDDVNAGQVRDAPLHLEFPKLVWNSKYKERAKELGLTVKDGKFTAEETRILTANWHRFAMTWRSIIRITSSATFSIHMIAIP